VDSDSAAPIVGREKELGALARALDALGGGDAGCLSVEGEPGIGKTRLLAELRGRAGARGQSSRPRSGRSASWSDAAGRCSRRPSSCRPAPPCGASS
jgi:AAA ATPase domain